MQRVIALAFATGTLALAAPAQASDAYMWGIGARIGSTAIPTQYPALWPTRINKYDVNDDGETDVNANGVEQETSLAKVGGDFILGGEGYYWLNKTQRIGGLVGLDTAKGWTDVHLLAKYDQVLTGGGDVDILLGGGLGVGTQTWKGLDADGNVVTDGEKLKMNYFPVRAELAAMIKITDEWSVAAKAFGQLNIPTNHIWTVEGEELDVAGSPFNYPQIGVEATVMWGDFKPPKPKGNDKGGNNDKGGKNDKGKGNDGGKNKGGGKGKGGKG